MNYFRIVANKYAQLRKERSFLASAGGLICFCFNCIIKKYNCTKLFYAITKGSWNSSEYQAEIDYLKRKGKLCVFPYPFEDGSYPLPDFFIDETGLCFCEIGGKKLYFSEDYSITDAQGYMHFLLTEQNPQSPHRYFTNDFPAGGNCLIDCGAAEGLEALLNIDSFDRIILLECEEKWVRALEKTMAPYADKVTIIPKFIGDVIDDEHTSLDRLVDEYAVDGSITVKMDIEGAEKQALSGAKKLLDRDDVRWLVCTYHEENDAQTIYSLFEEHRYKPEFSSGYMLFLDDMVKLVPPFFRRGLLRVKSRQE